MWVTEIRNDLKRAESWEPELWEVGADKPCPQGTSDGARAFKTHTSFPSLYHLINLKACSPLGT